MTAAPKARAADRPTLIQLLDFDRREGGSFIPMIRATLAEARSRNWRTSVMVFAEAHAAPWIDSLAADGVKILLAPAGLRGFRRGLGRWMRTQLPAEGPLVLHSHFHGLDMASWLATRGSGRTSLVWHIHSVYPRSPWQLTRALAKFGLAGRSVDAFLCPADNIVRQTIARGAPRSRVHMVPSAIQADEFRLVRGPAKAEAKRALGLDPEQTVLLHFGWHWHLKGGDVFCEVLKLLAESGRDVVGLERGGGERYTDYARKLGIEDRLVVHGPVDHIRDLHEAADVVVCSSREEGMAYATLEALCAGTPVVATAIPGHVYVGEHVAACRLTGHEVGEIAAGIEATLDRDPAVADAEAKAGREWVVDNLATEVVAAQLVDRYETLVEPRP